MVGIPPLLRVKASLTKDGKKHMGCMKVKGLDLQGRRNMLKMKKNSEEIESPFILFRVRIEFKECASSQVVVVHVKQFLLGFFVFFGLFP